MVRVDDPEPTSDSGLTSEMVYQMRTEFQTDPSERVAIQILENLIERSRNMSALSPFQDLWPELRNFLTTLLQEVPLQHMFEVHHGILLTAVQVCPDLILDYLFDEYLMKDKKLSQHHLGAGASAVAIAVIRRVTQDRSENIPKLLAPAVLNPTVKAILKGHLEGREANRAGHLLSYIDIVLYTFSEIDDLCPTVVNDLMTIVMDHVKNSSDLVMVAGLIHVFADTAKKTANFVNYLDSQNHIETFGNMLLAAKENPDGAFDYEGLFSLFAVMARSVPELIKGPKFKCFIDGLFDKIAHYDYLDAQARIAVFDYLFNCVATAGAKRVMDTITTDQGRSLMETALQKVCVNIATVNTVQRVQLLEGLAIAFSNAESTDSDIMQKWFNYFDAGMVPAILHYMNTIDSFQSMAAMNLTKALMKFDWAVPSFFGNDKFMEFLMDRDIRTDRSEAKQLKFDLIKEILNTNSPLLGAALKERLKIYLQQGVYHSEARAVPQVALANQ